MEMRTQGDPTYETSINRDNPLVIDLLYEDEVHRITRRHISKMPLGKIQSFQDLRGSVSRRRLSGTLYIDDMFESRGDSNQQSSKTPMLSSM